MLVLVIAALGCNKADPSATEASSASPGRKAASSAAASSTAAAASGDLGPSSLEVTWTGEWKPGDNPADEFPVLSVRNKDTARPLTYFLGWFYFYDKSGKQVGREFREVYSINIAHGEKMNVTSGPKKATLPAGTDKMEFVVTGANFGAESQKFRVATPPPEKRPMGG
jgi:hypothetical protein